MKTRIYAAPAVEGLTPPPLLDPPLTIKYHRMFVCIILGVGVISVVALSRWGLLARPGRERWVGRKSGGHLINPLLSVQTWLSSGVPLDQFSVPTTLTSAPACLISPYDADTMIYALICWFDVQPASHWLKCWAGFHVNANEPNV